MSLERLWAGWRSTYIEGVTNGDGGEAGEDRCLFCSLRAIDDDEEALIVERTELTFTVMNAYPYTTGHVMVVPLRHEAGIEGLSIEEGAAVFAALQRASVALRSTMHADGLNVGANLGRAAGAGVPGHCHFHVLPRWAGDTNFMTTIAEARVLPEDIRATWKKLIAAWPEMG